jgi:signal transduction histidine kinase/ActR/RegA family two-component response regulator
MTAIMPMASVVKAPASLWSRLGGLHARLRHGYWRRLGYDVALGLTVTLLAYGVNETGWFGELDEFAATLAQGDYHLVVEILEFLVLAFVFGLVLMPCRLYVSFAEARRAHAAERAACYSERRLKEQAELQRAILDSVPHGIAVYDTDMLLVAWNRHYSDLFSHTRPLIVTGRSFDELVRTTAENVDLGGMSVDEWLAQRHELVRRARTEPVTYEIALHDDTIIDTCISIMPNGYVVYTYTDVTERKVAEAQLRQAQKMEAVGQLSGGVAHEFNNLLLAIGGFAQMAQDTIDDPEQAQDSLNEVIACTARAAQLTRQLLAFSRDEVLEPKVVSLAEVVRGVERILRSLVGEAVQLEVDIVSERGMVRVDPTHFAQVIINLAINARDAMPDGGKVLVRVDAVELPQEFVAIHLGQGVGWHCTVSVRDPGCGMSADVQRHIFEPFFTTKEQGKGTGLGLAVTHGIVEQSGGMIDIASMPGVGTAITICLPMVEADAAAAAPATTAEPLLARGPATVLVVEDEPTVRRLVKGQLERLGYSVLVAANGAEALNSHGATAERIDALLTDVVMPQMSGVALAKVMASLNPDLRVLYMTGQAERSMKAADRPPAGTAVLRKPFNQAELAQAMAHALDRSEGCDAAAA